MATYATATELRTYAGADVATLPDATANRAIEQAELDLDGLSPVNHSLNTTTERRFTPSSLPTVQQIALRRATCAQAQYRLAMGEDFFIRGQHGKVTGPEFTVEGKLPRIGPQVWRELAGAGLINLTTTTGNRYTTENPRTEDWFPTRDARTEFEQG